MVSQTKIFSSIGQVKLRSEIFKLTPKAMCNTFKPISN